MGDSTLFQLLERAARIWPNDIAQVRGNLRLTFLQLKRAAERLAASLLDAHVQAGAKIGLLCPNGPEYIIGSFALFLIDAVVVPIFPGLKEIEITALDADMRLNGFCYTPELEGSLPKNLRSDPRRLDFDETAITLCLQKIDRETLDDVCADGPVGEEAPLIRFTSGTTSKAKGVIIPQSAMLEYTRRFANVYRVQKGDCILNLLSMAHIFYQITASMLRGAKLVVGGTASPRRFDSALAEKSSSVMG